MGHDEQGEELKPSAEAVRALVNAGKCTLCRTAPAAVPGAWYCDRCAFEVGRLLPTSADLAAQDAAERVKVRSKLKAILLQQESTADLLELVLEAHCELVREAFYEAQTNELADDGLDAPWSLTPEKALALQQHAPLMLKDFIDDLREQEKADLAVEPERAA